MVLKTKQGQYPRGTETAGTGDQPAETAYTDRPHRRGEHRILPGQGSDRIP